MPLQVEPLYLANSNDFSYNTNGALIYDYHRNISDIQYNVLNLPDQIALGDQKTQTVTMLRV
jgi:hypothetical protein